MLKSFSIIRGAALVIVIGFVAACSPEIVSRDMHSPSSSVVYPDAHDFDLPMMR